MLIDFDARFPDRDLLEHAQRNPSSSGDTTPPGAGEVHHGIRIGPGGGAPATDGLVALARVDHGRWIADCPVDGCFGAEFVSLSGRHGFFCTECRNAASGHEPIPVRLPDEKTVAQVDAYLSARPVPANRNWHPETETVKDLQRENREHGIRLP